MEEVRQFRRRRGLSAAARQRRAAAPPESLSSSADMKAYRLKIADATTAALKGDIVHEQELSSIATKSRRRNR